MTTTQKIVSFVRAALSSLRGGRLYLGWIAALALAVVPGVVAYLGQLDDGLGVTGLSDQVPWGSYIANFTYLIGMAAAAVMLVIPAYVFHNTHAQRVVLFGEALAVAACAMALMFIIVDLGHPERGWHLIPIIGLLNFPDSVMSWDVLALNGYLFINLAIPAYLLYQKFHGHDGHARWFPIAIAVAITFAIAIHTVTAFLFSSNAGRTFWHTALLGPRFLASAFAAGPAVILIAFRVIHEVAEVAIPKDVIRLLSRIVAISLQINLFMLFAEAFTELYSPTEHSVSFEYLVLGIGEHSRLVPWMRVALVMEGLALVVLMAEPLRRRGILLFAACTLTVVGVWIEKGIGLIIPGFVPTPVGEFLEYVPSLTEVFVSVGIWAFGLLLFTLLIRPILAIEIRGMRASPASSNPEPGPAPEGVSP